MVSGSESSGRTSRTKRCSISRQPPSEARLPWLSWASAMAPSRRSRQWGPARRSPDAPSVPAHSGSAGSVGCAFPGSVVDLLMDAPLFICPVRGMIREGAPIVAPHPPRPARSPTTAAPCSAWRPCTIAHRSFPNFRGMSCRCILPLTRRGRRELPRSDAGIRRIAALRTTGTSIDVRGNGIDPDRPRRCEGSRP